MKSLILLFTSASALIISHALADPTVSTPYGEICGKTLTYNNHTLHAYLGIPYAQPPVGKNRFRAPVPIEPWNDPLQATELPLACVQYTVDVYPWSDTGEGQSEDCLYLNVYVPQDRCGTEKMAVMFHIHGGSFITGSSRMCEYDARALAAEGDVIVVTGNYRLGALGFMYAHQGGAPGNAGLRDIIEALRWVNNNIECFGGDKEKITVFGSSVGGMSAGLLNISPVSRPLFKRTIMQSGSPAIHFTNLKEQIEGVGQKVAEIVGCADSYYTLKRFPVKVLLCLREVDPFTLQIASSTATQDKFVWFPMYGDKILPINPFQAVLNGDLKKSELLIGATRDEGSFFITTNDPKKFGFHGEKNALVDKPYAKDFVVNFLNGFPGTDAVLEHYIGSRRDNDYFGLRKNTYTAAGDFLFTCPMVYYAEKSADIGNNVYFYYLKRRPSNSVWAPWMGVAHSEELQSVFGMPLLHRAEFTAKERVLSRRVIKIWTTFAKTGTTSWQTYSRCDPKIFTLNTCDFGRIETGPHQENCNVMRPYFGF